MADKWTADDWVKVIKEIGVIVLSLVGLIAGIVGYNRSTDAQTKADTNAARVESVEKEVTGMRPMMYGAKKE